MGYELENFREKQKKKSFADQQMYMAKLAQPRSRSRESQKNNSNLNNNSKQVVN